MNLEKSTLQYIVVFIFFILNSCTESEICTKEVNVPIWNEKEQKFEDNFQEFPCGFNGINKSISEYSLNEKKELRISLYNK